MIVSKKRYIQGFFLIVVILAIIRCVVPSIAESRQDNLTEKYADTITVADRENRGNIADNDNTIAAKDYTRVTSQNTTDRTIFYNEDGTLKKNKIYSVSSFRGEFPDSNSVQLAAATKYGVSPVKDRNEAEHRVKDLVYIGSNPYYHVDKLNNSVPYLVPRAAVLLQDIGKAYYDSLQIKGIPLHKIIVTSVLRTRDDVRKLRNRNGNATENSCHLYGTTFDLCYNRYKTVEDPDGPARRAVRNDTLKWVLSEVLRDFRKQGRCYIKYEVKQGCFHMTVN